MIRKPPADWQSEDRVIAAARAVAARGEAVLRHGQKMRRRVGWMFRAFFCVLYALIFGFGALTTLPIFGVGPAVIGAFLTAALFYIGCFSIKKVGALRTLDTRVASPKQNEREQSVSYPHQEEHAIEAIVGERRRRSLLIACDFAAMAGLGYWLFRDAIWALVDLAAALAAAFWRII